jgi:hypothetical protein
MAANHTHQLIRKRILSIWRNLLTGTDVAAEPLRLDDVSGADSLKHRCRVHFARILSVIRKYGFDWRLPNANDRS